MGPEPAPPTLTACSPNARPHLPPGPPCHPAKQNSQHDPSVSGSPPISGASEWAGSALWGRGPGTALVTWASHPSVSSALRKREAGRSTCEWQEPQKPCRPYRLAQATEVGCWHFLLGQCDRPGVARAACSGKGPRDEPTPAGPSASLGTSPKDAS